MAALGPDASDATLNNMGKYIRSIRIDLIKMKTKQRKFVYFIGRTLCIWVLICHVVCVCHPLALMRLGRVQWVLTQISVSCPTQAPSLAQDIRMSRSNSGVFVCVGAGVGVLKHCSCNILLFFHDMETYPHHWSFVTGIHRSTVDSNHKRPAKRRFMIPLILVWTGCWTNIRVTGDLRRHDAHVIISVTFQRYIVHQCTIGFTKISSPSVNPGSTSWYICIRDQIIGLSFVLYSLPKPRQAGKHNGKKTITVDNPKNWQFAVKHLLLLDLAMGFSLVVTWSMLHIIPLA